MTDDFAKIGVTTREPSCLSTVTLTYSSIP